MTIDFGFFLDVGREERRHALLQNVVEAAAAAIPSSIEFDAFAGADDFGPELIAARTIRAAAGSAKIFILAAFSKSILCAPLSSKEACHKRSWSDPITVATIPHVAVR